MTLQFANKIRRVRPADAWSLAAGLPGNADLLLDPDLLVSWLLSMGQADDDDSCGKM